MGNATAKFVLPEERELNKKRAELAQLEEELSRKELKLATLRAELKAFEARYVRIIGVRYAELDEIIAQIAKLHLRLNPDDKNAQEVAAKARAWARKSARATDDTNEIKQQRFKASKHLKKLYRKVAKRIHPDLTTDSKERRRREFMMAAANRAYEEGDEAELYRILRRWESGPEPVKGKSPAAELIRVIRKIAQVRERLRIIETDISELKQSALYELKTKVEESQDKGRDLLAEMASRIDKNIALSKIRLKKLKVRVASI
jgi:hypothetical protein